ncbi:Tenascin [Hondaea fermentalgiana]|uniref:Tenascin n=1 Tax=Hondaea fermentalgiana TaxID=2315210 RepID=A0A2R5FZ37_9STRA|nr:Tenascin [Hondaea fermentalgiana]|eukprot:GBG24017.1 Tenascin [Hondaea fermentalgiana]
MQYTVLLVAALACLVSFGEAACPNACSGHGRCTNHAASFSAVTDSVNYYKPSAAGDYGYDSTTTKKDSCTCFLRMEDGVQIYDYTAPDCSLKTCPSGPAIGGLPYADDNHNQITECSGVGTCDRSTGECACQTGFTGKNCGRRTCPNNCNDHGKCLLLKDIVSQVASADSNFEYDTSALSYDAPFDATISAGCFCDEGFMGPDCSLHQCPTSADPMDGYGSESGRECSGRGSCNYNTGACTCFEGYYGTACEVQHVNFS